MPNYLPVSWLLLVTVRLKVSLFRGREGAANRPKREQQHAATKHLSRHNDVDPSIHPFIHSPICLSIHSSIPCSLQPTMWDFFSFHSSGSIRTWSWTV